jgi:hypothetical protein
VENENKKGSSIELREINFHGRIVKSNKCEESLKIVDSGGNLQELLKQNCQREWSGRSNRFVIYLVWIQASEDESGNDSQSKAGGLLRTQKDDKIKKLRVTRKVEMAALK